MVTRNIKWWFEKVVLVAGHPILCSKRVRYNIMKHASDCLSLWGYYDYPYKIIYLAGMPLGGTTWMKNLLARIPGYYTRPEKMPGDVYYRQDFCDSAFDCLPQHGYTLFKTHLNPTVENLDCIRRNGVEKILVTYRDLRDVLISRYYRLIDFPKPKNAYDFIDYRALGKEKALEHSLELVSTQYAAWIRGWLELAKREPERFHFTKFEQLKNDTKGELQKVLNFYGIKLTEEKIASIIEAAKPKGTVKKNMKEAALLPGGYSSNFRSGKVGTWRQELTGTQIKRCKELLGEVLIELGYERDLNWG